MANLNTKIFNGQTVTGANVYVSQWLDLSLISVIGLEIQMTGTPTGSFGWEVSNQFDPNTNAGAVFISGSAPSPAFPVPAGAPVSYVGGVAVTSGANSCRYARIRYTNTAGTGVLDCWVHGRTF